MATEASRASDCNAQDQTASSTARAGMRRHLARFALPSLRATTLGVLTILVGLASSVQVVRAQATTAPAVAAGTAPAANETRINDHVFKLPPGFTIELVAGPPLVDRPITASFDERGRLYVADSSGSNDKVDKQLAEKPHRIVRLEDTNGDGQFDRSVVFADSMMFPEGTLWYDGSLYVAAPPSIWKLTDTNDDGVADERTEWFQGKTLTGCANDLHGPYLGRDGWIYWCKGAFAEQTYERPGRAPFVTKASHIFRSRPDGSRLEPVMTGGMDNPVDVVFTPEGERIFTTTFLQHPGGGRRDGMLHAVYGGVHGKVWQVIENHPRTGDVLPVLSHLGPAAPCGLEHYDAAVFGPEYRNNIFACLFNMHKVTRHVVEPVGASFRTRDSDFVVSNNIDFHPTDVLTDADGSLLIVDTGGWYKLCCPTSQLWKPDILGAIYRVRRAGAKGPDDPRGQSVAWDKLSDSQLVELLGDARPAVRDQAMHRLGARGESAVPAVVAALGKDRSVEIRRNAVWTSGRWASDEARRIARLGLADSDRSVRLAALQVASLWRDAGARQGAANLLRTGDAAERRGAAELLGRLGDRDAALTIVRATEELRGATADDLIPSLSGDQPTASTASDRFLEHSLIYALIELEAADAALEALGDPSPWTRRAALLALDQMPGGRLDAVRVSLFLASPDPVVRETAVWIVDRHPEWGDSLAGYLRQQLATQPIPAPSELERQLTLFARQGSVQQLLATVANDSAQSAAARTIALRAMRGSGVKETPGPWRAAIVSVLGGSSEGLIAEAAAAARALPSPKGIDVELNAALVSVGRSDKLPLAVRLDALAALPPGVVTADSELFTLLSGQLDRNLPVPQRTAAADIVTRLKLSGEQLLALVDRLASAGPLEADRLLAAFEQTTDERIGLKLTGALKDSKILTSVRADTLKQRLAKYPASVQTEVQGLLAVIQADALRQKDRLDQLAKNLAGGDVRRGHAVFHSAKAACSSCHAMGYLGGRVGPDLTRIGSIRTERDLLESIVLPSASFVRSYEPLVAITHSGKTFNGLLKKELPDGIVLQVNAIDEVSIPRDDLEELRPSRISVMPSGLDQQLSPQELADLIAFLKNAK